MTSRFQLPVFGSDLTERSSSLFLSAHGLTDWTAVCSNGLTVIPHHNFLISNILINSYFFSIESSIVSSTSINSYLYHISDIIYLLYKSPCVSLRVVLTEPPIY